MPRAFVIMEAAGCHDGDAERAKELVRLADAVGADAVKFQWLSSPERLAERRRAPEYLAAYRTIAFPRSWFDWLPQYATSLGLQFMCTSYLPEDIAVIAPHVASFKVSSFESLDAGFVCLHALYDKQLILSAGMNANPRPVLAKYNAVRSQVFPNGMEAGVATAVLHCVSAYPCPEDEVRLAVLQHRPWMDPGIMYAGLSDHTLHPWTGALAVAAGAQIVEFHARCDDTRRDNADYLVARTPDMAYEYVRNIRKAEAMLGAGRPTSPSEQPYVKYRVAGCGE